MLSPGYRSGIYYRRNRNLADASSACIAYMTRANSGTGYTVRYAQEHGLRVINLAGALYLLEEGRDNAGSVLE